VLGTSLLEERSDKRSNRALGARPHTCTDYPLGRNKFKGWDFFA